MNNVSSPSARTDQVAGSEHLQWEPTLLWQQLHAESWVLTDQVPLALPAQASAPWYMHLMLGLCGCFTAFFFMIFSEFLFIDWLDLKFAVPLMGGILIGIAGFITRFGSNDLWRQVAFGLGMAGQTIAGFWLVHTFGDNIAWPWFCVALVQIMLVVLIPGFLLRLLTTFSSVLFLQCGCLIGCGFSPVLPVCAALVALLWLDESYWQVRLRHVYLPIVSGLSLALAGLVILATSTPFLASGGVDNRYRFLGGGLDQWLSLLEPVIVGVIFLTVVAQLAHPLPRVQRMVAFASGLALAILGGWIMGLELGVMLILLGFARGRRTLMIAGIVASFGYLSWFYYSLPMTLVFKSIGLMLTGVAFLVAYYILSRLSTEVGTGAIPEVTTEAENV
ncbi:DUF4401 domain-containing protein [Glaciimonas immobilis]|uniref:DUF4401 domain-containing protein n=1 Tax=Glaciimonas immobilis TaxID=728004 RepID=A0A840RM79_9BURK|nr:DUF4401 domain-containing protein [Glaciimonas immobilis]KAF3997929.1 DUF4401 domain-containing protein [Glaciimonas immobilis]MBB5199407.1 hypothetical protein [Glaciimonas immobilis]